MVVERQLSIRFSGGHKGALVGLCFLVGLVTLGSTQASAQTPVYQINSGGGAVSPFAADQFDMGGLAATPVTNPIDVSHVTNPAPQGVYQTEYYCCLSGPGPFTYTFPNLMAGSVYQVRLHFSENYNNAVGAREFNVVINGTQVLTNFDVFAATGAEFRAIVKQFNATANSGGQIVINFNVGAVGKPMVEGIEILTIGTPPAPPNNVTATAGNAQVSLTWTTSTGAASYNVKRSTVSGGPYTTIASPNTTSFTDSGLTNGTTYFYVVSAVDSNGESANSSQVSAKPVAPDFSISASPPSESVTQGNNTTYTVTIGATNGFTGMVNLSASGLLAGSSASFGPGSVTGSGTPTLTISTTSTASTGTVTLTITGTSGSLSHSTSVKLAVNSAPGGGTPVFQINSGGGAVSPFVADEFDTGGLAATPVTNSIDTSHVTNPAPQGVYQTEYYCCMSNGGPFTYTLPNLTAGANYAVRLHFSENYRTGAGQRQFNVVINGTQVLTNFDVFAATGGQFIAIVKQFSTTANSSGQIVINFNVGAVGKPMVNGIEVLTAEGGGGSPDFGVSASPNSQTVTAGASTTYTASVTALNGFTGNVSLSASGLPSGASASFNPTSVAGSGTSTVTVSTSASTPAGTYTVTFTGTSGGLTHSANVTLTVQAAIGGGDFSISASPGSQEVIPGHSVPYSVSIGALSGFTGTVNLSASGLPSNTTASFNPTSVSGSGSSTMTVATTTATPAGTFTLTITGTSGSVSHSTTVTLVQRWTLFWSDEFNGPAGSPPDPNKWNIDIGGGGWGTGEIECFTNSPNNLAMDGNGNLVITALHQPGFACPGGTTNDYTSARINTRNFAGVNKFTHTYGWWESRIKLPSTQGTFPAFWHLGDNNVCIGTGWPACGEVDTLENLGREPSTSHSGIHGPGYTNGLGCSYNLPSGQVFSADYHTFAMLWEVNSISFFVDGNLCGTVTSSDIPAGTTWIFNAPKGMNIIYDFAIGGPWPGNPDSTSVWPQHMVIDYVRVFDKAF